MKNPKNPLNHRKAFTESLKKEIEKTERKKTAMFLKQENRILLYYFLPTMFRVWGNTYDTIDDDLRQLVRKLYDDEDREELNYKPLDRLIDTVVGVSP